MPEIRQCLFVWRELMIPATIDRPAHMMEYAIKGCLTKHALANLLAPESRPRFLDACAKIEESYTGACAAEKGPCLESGCSCAGEICLQPLLRAATEYQSACGVEWAKLFADGQHLDAAWQQTLSEYDLA
jgi:hypothetical protein